MEGARLQPVPVHVNRMKPFYVFPDQDSDVNSPETDIDIPRDNEFVPLVPEILFLIWIKDSIHMHLIIL